MFQKGLASRYRVPEYLLHPNTSNQEIRKRESFALLLYVLRIYQAALDLAPLLIPLFFAAPPHLYATGREKSTYVGRLYTLHSLQRW